MGAFIGFGDFNRKYFYIFMAIFCKFAGQLILGLNYSILKGLPSLSKELSSSSITYFTSNFFCSLIIGILGYKISQIIQGDKETLLDSINSLEPIKSINSKKSTNSLNSLNSSFNSLNDLNSQSNDNKEKDNKIKKKLCLIGLIFVFCEVFDQLFYSNGLEGLDYWMFEILFLKIFMSLYLNYSNMLHQRIALYIIVIPSFFLKIISNNLKSKNNNNLIQTVYEYITYEFGTIWIPLFIMSFIIMSSIRALGNTNVKYLMDILYVSPFTILIIYGAFGLLFSFLYIGFDLIFNKKYLGELNCFKKNTLITLIFTLLYGITHSLKILFDIFFIRDLSPFHMFAKYKIYYLMIQIILLSHHFIDKFRTFYFVEILTDIICFFGVLIYLELIELRCCGLNYYLKKNIIERSSIESKTEIFKEGKEKEKIKLLDNLYVVNYNETYIE